MCVICVKPKGVILTEECIKTCYDQNRDGFGFGYVEENVLGLGEDEVCLVKGMFSFEKVMEYYEPHKEKQCVLHFRVSTSKNVTGNLCHPFRINDTLLVFHNGSINCIPRTKDIYNDEMSDTWNFNEIILKPILAQEPDLWKTSQFNWLMRNAIQGQNKLVFLSSSGETQIVGEDRGEWEKFNGVNSVWFSNKSYKSYKAGFKVFENEEEDKNKVVFPPLSLPVKSADWPTEEKGDFRDNDETKDYDNNSNVNNLDIDEDDEKIFFLNNSEDIISILEGDEIGEPEEDDKTEESSENINSGVEAQEQNQEQENENLQYFETLESLDAALELANS